MIVLVLIHLIFRADCANVFRIIKESRYLGVSICKTREKKHDKCLGLILVNAF